MNEIPYAYEAIDRAGARCRGVTRASTTVDAYRRISASGFTPLSISAVRQRRTWRWDKKPSMRDVAQFTYQFSVLIGAGVPIGEGLRSIAEQEASGKFHRIVLAIAGKIESGEPIADSMAEHERVFGNLYIETVRAAEQSGNLVEVLEYLSEMLERLAATRQQVRSALMYPACVIVALVCAVFVLLGFVVPRFAVLFAQRNVEMPAPTQVLMALGQSVQQFWWLYLAAMVGSALALRAAWRTPDMRWYLERVLHRIPILRGVLVAMAVARFTRVLGLCLKAGLGLIDAIQMAGNASGRPMLQRDAERMVNQVRTGGRLATVMVMCEYLSPFARRMLISGEESAQLTRMCGIVARHCEREAEVTTKNLSTLIEPVLIVLIAAVVLFVALAIFLPMWDMVKLMS